MERDLEARQANQIPSLMKILMISMIMMVMMSGKTLKNGNKLTRITGRTGDAKSFFFSRECKGLFSNELIPSCLNVCIHLLANLLVLLTLQSLIVQFCLTSGVHSLATINVM